MVPGPVPSLFQTRNDRSSSETKNTASLEETRSLGKEDIALLLRSLMNTVPSGVPSDFHSSFPISELGAPLRNRRSPTGVIESGKKRSESGFTRTVPSGLPSLLQNSP